MLASWRLGYVSSDGRRVQAFQRYWNKPRGIRVRKTGGNPNEPTEVKFVETYDSRPQWRCVSGSKEPQRGPDDWGDSPHSAAGRLADRNPWYWLAFHGDRS